MSASKYLVLSVLWTIGILVGLSLPGRSLPSVSLLEFDKLIHFLLFAGFAWLWMAALRAPLRRRTLYVLAAGATYAVLSELYQSLLPFDRRADLLDVLADMAGLCAGLLLYHLRLRRKSINT